MKRRSFFGFAAGALAAGPSMAKEAVGYATQAAQGLNVPPIPMSYAQEGALLGAGDVLGSIVKKSAKEHAQEQLAALLAPDARRDFHRRQQRREHARYNSPAIDALRSVAPWKRAQMLADHILAMEDLRSRSYFEATIAGLFGDGGELY